MKNGLLNDNKGDDYPYQEPIEILEYQEIRKIIAYMTQPDFKNFFRPLTNNFIFTLEISRFISKFA